jgi:hypothetical protein
VAIETVDIKALRTTQVQALTTAQVAKLSTDQTTALTSSQIVALTTTQIAVMSTAQTSTFTVTPIILDLNGDGVKTLGMGSGVKFDIFADGSKVNTGWVSSGDGLLVLDRNGDGTVNDGSELFGSATKLSNGQKAVDGYAALSSLDTNGDGLISSKDSAFAQLKVWVDSNSDGISETGEMKSLADLGITSMSLNASAGNTIDNGNIIGLTSSYQTNDGANHAMGDVWFLAKQAPAVVPPTVSVDEAIAQLAKPVVVDGGSMPTASPLVGTPVDSSANNLLASSPDLRTRVSGLAQAIGSFEVASASGTGGTGTTLPAGSSVSQDPTAQAVSSMVSVMKQFDANGKALTSPSALVPPLVKPAGVPGVNDPNANGYLTSGSGLK